MLRTGCGESLSSLEFSRESSAELGPYSMVLLVDDVLRLPSALMRRTWLGLGLRCQS